MARYIALQDRNCCANAGSSAAARPATPNSRSGYRLPARYVIHTVGPVWRGGRQGEPELLASCYQRALELAASHDVATIAIPSISTGIYGYPVERAAEIAVATVRRSTKQSTCVAEVIFCCFSSADLQVYQRVLAQ